MFNGNFATCPEQFFYFVPEEPGVLVELDWYETCSFIDKYLHGKMVKKIVAGTDDLICSYYLPGDNMPFAVSRLKPCGFSYFLRKVGCNDVRKFKKEVYDDYSCERIS